MTSDPTRFDPISELEMTDSTRPSENLRGRAHIPYVPLCVLGLGVYRAWIELCFVGSFIDYPARQIAGHDMFDIVMIVTLLLGAYFARKLVPFSFHGWIPVTGAILLITSTLLSFVSVFWPDYAVLVAWPAAICGGIGIALTILVWSEFYSKLGPVRICLYYALSLIVGAAIIWIYKGFVTEWLPVTICLLPLVSFACLYECYCLPGIGTAFERDWVAFTFPWKPVLIVAAYSFAFGFQEIFINQQSGPHSAPGMVACCAIIAALIIFASKRIEFSTVYGRILPIMASLSLITPILCSSFFGLDILSFLANFGYGACEIFIMTMIGSLSYHYGVNAVWLFGIERAVRALAMMVGRWFSRLIPSGSETVAAAFVIIILLIASFIFLTEGRIFSDWGVQMQPDEQDTKTSEARRRNRLTTRCDELGARFNLSQREEEVLLLLSEHCSISEIEQELCIANGTAKAHVRHIYQKLDIHNRDELFALVEVDS